MQKQCTPRVEAAPNTQHFIRRFSGLSKQVAEKVYASEKSKYGKGGTGSLIRISGPSSADSKWQVTATHSKAKWKAENKNTPAKWS